MIIQKINTFLNANKLRSSIKTLKKIRAFTLTQKTNEALTAAVAEIRKRHLERKEPIEPMIPELFAIGVEVVRRTLGLNIYDSQLLGGLALGTGRIVEMRTGEGKTLVVPFGALLQYVQGRPVHVCTINEYLAERDANMMHPVYTMLGMSVAVTRAAQSQEVRRQVYMRDVVYGTHQIFAMDFLRDKVVLTQKDVRQASGHGAVIVDEADAVLIDDARTPITLTMPKPVELAEFEALRRIALSLKMSSDEQVHDFDLDLVSRTAVLSDDGYLKVTQMLRDEGLLGEQYDDYSPAHQTLILAVISALGAEYLLLKDRNYVVQNGRIVLVDAITGRLQPDKSWDSGLQQALEVKEGLPLSPDFKVLGRISLKNFFKQYATIAGLTGTALTDQEEFKSVYGLDVVVVEPNKPSQREDLPDRFFLTEAEKMKAIFEDIQTRHQRQQPILIGTASIEHSEMIHEKLNEMGIANRILTAKHHADESAIVAQAGVKGAVTVATNMAGRGTDIILGGNKGAFFTKKAAELDWSSLSAEEKDAKLHEWEREHAVLHDEVVALGGLHIIGVERYETLRMDMQLRGRAGRQGDPGSSQFYVSLEDPMVEAHAAERIHALMSALDIDKGDVLHEKLVIDAINQAQRAEQNKFANIRKTLLEEDDVLEIQRNTYYALRESIFEDTTGRVASGFVQEAMLEFILDEVSRCGSLGFIGQDELPQVVDAFAEHGISLDITGLEEGEPGVVAQLVYAQALKLRELNLQTNPKFAEVRDTSEKLGISYGPHIDRIFTLMTMDAHWFNHLEHMAQIKKGMHLRAFAKENPKQAYEKEGFVLFSKMFETVKNQIAIRSMTTDASEV